MQVEVRVNRRDASRRIVFHEFVSVRTEQPATVIGYPDRQETTDLEPGIHEVMITRVMFNRDEIGQEDPELGPKCFFFRRPTSEDVAVSYSGFEMSGNMASTTTSGVVVGRGVVDWSVEPTAGEVLNLITPGRLVDDVYVSADGTPPIPGRGWVRRTPKGTWRLEGVRSFDELMI